MTAAGFSNPVQAAPGLRGVIYVGDDAPLIAQALAPLSGTIELKTESTVAAALLAAAQHKASAVIVDLVREDDARVLLVAALAAAKEPPRIIVLARSDAVERYLRLPSVHSVITVPLMPSQLRAAVSERRQAPRQPATPPSPPAVEPTPALKSPEAEAKHTAWPGWRLYLLASGRFMAVVSNLYKNAAFVLLATLFGAFSFYGFLIAYFLLSSGWGAPMTLTRGHQLVEKAINDLGELDLALSQNIQRHSEAELEARTAASAFEDASVLVDFMKGTVDAEIAARLKEAHTTQKAIGRMQDVLKQYGESGGSESTRRDLRDLYRKRLITRKTYDAQLLGSLEASQRLSALETEIDTKIGEKARLETSIDQLQVLKVKLDNGLAGGAATGNADLMLLTKQVVDARSALDQARTRLASAEDRKRILEESARLMRDRIAEIRKGALGRAADGRIDVIFVPYGNERRFTPGAPLYSCAMTVVICHRAGTVGHALPGESTAVHPFFGKPLRGFFVEAKLDDPDAASEEIIHAGRPPFFF